MRMGSAARPPRFDTQQRQAYHSTAAPHDYGQPCVAGEGWHGNWERPTQQAVGRQEESTMRRSTVGIILALALNCLVTSHIAEAQQPGKVYRIGVLGAGY